MHSTRSAHKKADDWKHKADELAPLLEHETFTLREAGVDITTQRGHDLNGLLSKLRRSGLVERVEREPVEYHDKDGGSWVWRYAWADGVREQFRAYREQADSLPCGCREHVPDSRDDPEGVVSCKFCGREYDAERFRELVG